MLRDLQKFWKAFGSREKRSCCYQLLYMMIIQNAQPGLEIPALQDFQWSRSGRSCSTSHMLWCQCRVQSLVLVLALCFLPWYKFSPLICLPSLFPFPHKVPRGSTGKLLGCLLLSWPLALSCIHKSGETSKAESWYCLDGHYSKVMCVRKAGAGKGCAGASWAVVVPCTSNGSVWPCQRWFLQFFTSVSISGPAPERTLKCLFPKPSGSVVILYKYLPNKAIFSPNLNNPSSLSHMLFGMNLFLLR